MAKLMTLDEVRNWCNIYPGEQDPIFVQNGYNYGRWILHDEDEKDFFTQVIMGDLKCWTARPTEKQMIGESEKMIDIKALAEANRHCREKNCEGCPFKDQNDCSNREKLNAEVFVDFLDMLDVKEH